MAEDEEGVEGSNGSSDRTLCRAWRQGAVRSCRDCKTAMASAPPPMNTVSPGEAGRASSRSLDLGARNGDVVAAFPVEEQRSDHAGDGSRPNDPRARSTASGSPDATRKVSRCSGPRRASASSPSPASATRRKAMGMATETAPAMAPLTAERTAPRRTASMAPTGTTTMADHSIAVYPVPSIRSPTAIPTSFDAPQKLVDRLVIGVAKRNDGKGPLFLTVRAGRDRAGRPRPCARPPRRPSHGSRSAPSTRC